ncbi:espin-like isoform X1 [Haliotis cracherodii]|uniref:espin-like isoform X1 n=1 Tax=Haliotis cracherodii TaxID=6455 RepID=UPI0039E8DC02
MVIKRKDFQKAAAFIHEFLLKLNEDGECAELRDTLNLALLHMQKYYRILQSRSHEKNSQNTLQLTARGLSPMTPFVDTPDKFQWKWMSMDSFTRLASTMSVEDSMNFVRLPPVIQAAMDGDLQEIEQLVHHNPVCVNDQDGIGRTALTYAVHFDHPQAVNTLLEQRADVNLTAHDGSTAIHQACHDANLSALSLMLDYGGDVSIQDTHGRAAIHWAVTSPSHECLALLLEHNADPGIRDKDGLSPAMWACRMDHIEHFELLSRADNSHIEEPDGIERDANGRTWMHWAVRRTEPLECLQTLITADTAAIKDDDGKTVLLLAAEMGSLLAAKLIMEIAGRICIHDTDAQGRTALHLATIRGHGEIVNFLLEQGVDLTVVDSFNATAWDYARNRQLHYCQLIIMSHQRQRIASNPTSPMVPGMGLIDSLHIMNGDVNQSEDFTMKHWPGKSGDTTPVTPPHPPKRPRTSRPLLSRRANSLSTPEGRDKTDVNGDRVISSAGNERKKERIEVSVDTKRTANIAFYANGREETDMITDEHDGHVEGEEDVDGVSVGGMDVSDIDDDEDRPQPRARPAPAPRPQTIQPRPPPRHTQPRPPPPSSFSQPQELQHNSHPQQQQEPSQYEALEEGFTTTTSMIDPPPGQRFQNSQKFSAPQGFSPAYRTGRTGPAPSPPNITPQRPHMIRQQQPLPPRPAPREAPAPRPGSGPSSRDQVASPPPLSSGSGQSVEQGPSMKKPLSPDQGNRPGSGGQTKPPGVLEGRRIPPPPMLTPLPNAPKVPSLSRLDKLEKKKKKKKRDRDKEREQDTKSPPEVQNLQNPLDIPPPRGFAAPLHPFPQQTERVRSAAPSAPRASKGLPQHHDSRYSDETEDSKGVVINGHTLPMKDTPARSARPGQRLQPMEEEETQYTEAGGDNPLQQPSIPEEGQVGPLIPPPQAFRSGGRYSSAAQGRQLSQSVPQDGHSSARMMPTSAKPPLPIRGRSSAGVSGRTSRNSNTRSSVSRRTPRPPTSRSDSSS